MEPVEPQAAPVEAGERETDGAPGGMLAQTPAEEFISANLLIEDQQPPEDEEFALKALIEAVIYITDEPLSAQQIAAAVEQPIEKVSRILEELTLQYQHPSHGLSIRELAGGYKMSTKPEHHDAIRRFVKNLKPPLKLSLAALETLAVIAYKQPITAPEIMEIRGVQGAGVLKTLIERKLVAPAGRKAVVGKPILYKTTKDFLIQFGLNDLAELPTLKEFEELNRFAVSDLDTQTPQPEAPPEATSEPTARGALDPSSPHPGPAELCEALTEEEPARQTHAATASEETPAVEPEVAPPSESECPEAAVEAHEPPTGPAENS